MEVQYTIKKNDAVKKNYYDQKYLIFIHDNPSFTVHLGIHLIFLCFGRLEKNVLVFIL